MRYRITLILLRSTSCHSQGALIVRSISSIGTLIVLYIASRDKLAYLAGLNVDDIPRALEGILQAQESRVVLRHLERAATRVLRHRRRGRSEIAGEGL